MTKPAQFMVNNQPISAMNGVDTQSTNQTINEVALSSYKCQLVIFPQAYSATKEKIKTVCGLELPQWGNKSEDSQIKILAVQPNKWLFISDEPLTWLDGIVDNENVFSNEQSSAYSVIEIKGKDTLSVMQGLSFIDWQSAAPIVLTQLATDYSGIVEKMGDTPEEGYRVYVTRSMAKSFWETLGELC